FQFQDFAFDIDGNLLRQVAIGDGFRHVGDVAHLVGQVAGHEVDAVSQVFPGAGHALDVSLTAQLTFGAHFAGHACHFGGEGAKLLHHGVDGFLQLEDFAFDVDGDFLGEVAVGDGGGHFGDVADLSGQVAGHRVDAIGQVLPRAGNTFDSRLAG